jgi:hypothetical protein
MENTAAHQAILQPYINQDISDIKVFSGVLEQLQEKTDGLVIIDFMDYGNWDCFEGFEVNKSKNTVQLIWHDFRTRQETEEEKEMRQIVFPAELYGLFMHFRSFKVLPARNSALLLVRGYALEDKDINVNLQPGTQDFKILKRNAFSDLVFRKIKGKVQVVLTINTHLFSVLIAPKGMGITSGISKKILYAENAKDLLNRLSANEKALKAIDKLDSDALSEKSNTIRRILESMLKIYSCYFDRTYEKPYSRLLLGDLAAGLREHLDEGERKIIDHLIECLNPDSHDSGRPVSKERIQICNMFVSELVRILEVVVS